MQFAISEACSINAKFDFKIEISQFNQQKRGKTLANYSNIKPTLPSYRIFKRMKFQ
jgi:hypothetical protein